MARRPRPDPGQGFPLRTVKIVALCLATLATASAAATAAPMGPYEPNDTITRAAGPLVSGTPVNAAVEAANDPDWYYLTTNAPGPVALSLTLTGCAGTTTPAATCSNVQMSAFDGEGGLLARGNANAVAQTLALEFDGKVAGRISIEIRSGVAGATYTLGATFPSPASPDATPVKYPDVLPAFRTRFELTYTGTTTRPRNRKIAGLVVQGVEPGTTIVVRCTKGCAKRYRKTVTAESTSRRLGGLPLALKRDTRMRIEIRRPGYVGRFKDYSFTTKVPTPRTASSGCTSPYDFAPILCAS